MAVTELTDVELLEEVAAVPFWWHRIELRPGVVSPGMDDTPARLHQMCLPERLDGMTVLDIGAYDGYFSFECERRGAVVTAFDVLAPEQCGFRVASRARGSRVTHRRGSIYNLDPADFGQFDIVLCLGVIYHLRHPLLALDRVYSVCKDLLILESQICDGWFVGADGRVSTLATTAPALGHVPIAQFYPGSELNGDPSNWWSPNQAALAQMLATSGFEPTPRYSDGVRAVFHGRKIARTQAVEAEVADEQRSLTDARETVRRLGEELDARRAIRQA
jgi:tRNA (mo5U34)-methyltransferase